MTVTKDIKAAIKGSGLSRYRLSMESGVSQAVLSRFMAGKQGLSTDTIDALSVVLRMKLVFKGPTQAVKERQEGK